MNGFLFIIEFEKVIFFFYNEIMILWIMNILKNLFIYLFEDNCIVFLILILSGIINLLWFK